MDSGLDATHRPGMTASIEARAMQKLLDGQITQNLSSPSAKNISLCPWGKSVVSLRPSHPNEGRVAIVTNVAVRCGGREAREKTSACCADGEVVWF
jgi:hypothetical protein